jgi:aminoglycoside phosphotransferase (APT) family kinase protein
VTVTAAEFVARWFPGSEARRLDGGWTSDTFEVDGWIVQVARSAYASERLRHQARVVPRLAPHLTTAIPIPELIAQEPTAIRYRKLEGTPCDEAPLGRWPEQLGALLGALHALPPAAIGLDPVGPEILRDRQRAACDRLRAAIVPRLAPDERTAADALLDHFLDERHWRFTPAITHSDLGPEHVLVDSAGDLAAVIDWEELDAGHPIGDFAWWIHALPEIGERMLRGYGAAIDDEHRAWARLAYAIMPWYEVDHGIRTHDDDCIASGLAGVRARMLRCSL